MSTSKWRNFPAPENQKDGSVTRTWSVIASLKMEEGVMSLEKARNGFSSRASRKECSSTDIDFTS